DITHDICRWTDAARHILVQHARKHIHTIQDSKKSCPKIRFQPPKNIKREY
ncbi:unnamed protein product, partial [Ectocarpus fasciculatus]